MPDISKVNGVEVGNISKVDTAETGNINTLLSGSFPAQQADPALTSLTNEDFNAHKASGLATAYNPTDKIMIFQYGDTGNNSYATVVCATASGSTLSYGDEVVINSEADSFSSGVVYNDDQDRVMGAFMVYSGSDVNTVKAYAASLTTSGSGSPKISSIGSIGTLYNPNDDGSSFPNLHGPEGQMCIYDHSDGASAGRMLVFFAKGGETSGSSVAGDRSDVVGAAVTITNVSSNNNVTVGALQQLQDVNGYSTDPPMVWSWNEQRNKVVLFTQDVSGTFQVQAATVTGTGATMTVNTQYLLDTGSANILFHNSNFGYDGSSEARFRMDNSKRVVYDSTNNCHHIFIWDDTKDDFHLFNCTVAANNTITWTQANSSPLRSNGIIAQYGNVFTNGATSGWDTSGYNNLGLAFSAGRGRGAVFGHNSTHNADADINVAGFVYSSTTGYNFTGNYFEMFTNKPKKQVTSPSGTTHLSDDGFVGSNLFFVGSNQDSDGMTEIGAFDTGVGQRAIAGGIFSASNAVLATARSRNSVGIGNSRIASMTGGGTTTAGTSGRLASTEEYNGNVISAGGNMATARQSPSGTGPLTAGLALGGTTSGGEVKTSEEYDGSSWSSGGTANVTGGEHSGMCGTQTDAVSAGGYVGSYQTQIEDYDGTSWSDTTVDLDDGKAYLGAAGTSNDCIFFGGTGSGGSANRNRTEEFDGTSIATVNSMSNGRNVFQSAGTKSDVILTGGSRIANDDSEYWNGTSWASGPTNGLSSVDRYSAGDNQDCGGTSAAVFFGGGTSTAYSGSTTMVAHFDH